MDNIDILNNCLALTKCGFYISVNEHKDVYETTEKYIEHLFTIYEEEDLNPKIKAKIIETNTLIRITAYSRTPVGNYTIFHYDLNRGLTEMLKLLESEENDHENN